MYLKSHTIRYLIVNFLFNYYNLVFVKNFSICKEILVTQFKFLIYLYKFTLLIFISGMTVNNLGKYFFNKDFLISSKNKNQNNKFEFLLVYYNDFL